MSEVMAPGGVEVEWTPLPGGWSGESFLSRVDGRAQVVRIYAPTAGRRSDIAEMEEALVRLLRGLVPTPSVLEVRPARDGMPALLVTEHIDGTRGDELLRRVAAGELEPAVGTRVAAQLGAVAGRLAGIPTLARGSLAAPDLRVVADPVRADLLDSAEELIPRLREWSAGERASLMELCGRAQRRLDEVGRTSLVHGDLSPRNALFDRDGRLVAVVDWEHAHAGDPHADLGALIRFDRDPEWEQAAVGAWAALVGGTVEEHRDLARCADLRTLLVTAVRPGGNLVVDLADLYLREVAATGDWHAVPSG